MGNPQSGNRKTSDEQFPTWLGAWGGESPRTGGTARVVIFGRHKSENVKLVMGDACTVLGYRVNMARFDH